MLFILIKLNQVTKKNIRILIKFRKDLFIIYYLLFIIYFFVEYRCINLVNLFFYIWIPNTVIINIEFNF